tara:strand:+ start:7502 stop:8257 length:756 start_codon:yes stop_codon:yes gene_type:complete
MINIDTIYQQVLSLSNKEQRGYITPQEFNLYAQKASNEIFFSYFDDFKTLASKPKTNKKYSDEQEMLNQKLQFHKATAVFSSITTTAIVPHEVAFIDAMYIGGSFTDDGNDVRIDLVDDKSDLLRLARHPLTKPSDADDTLPVKHKRVYAYYTAVGSTDGTRRLNFSPALPNINVNCYYYQEPQVPKWGYVVVNDKALFNTTASTHFFLHPSEMQNLTNKILGYAGITLYRADLMQAAAQEKQVMNVEKNN